MLRIRKALHDMRTDATTITKTKGRTWKSTIYTSVFVSFRVCHGCTDLVFVHNKDERNISPYRFSLLLWFCARLQRKDCGGGGGFRKAGQSTISCLAWVHSHSPLPSLTEMRKEKNHSKQQNTRANITKNRIIILPQWRRKRGPRRQS